MTTDDILLRVQSVHKHFPVEVGALLNRGHEFVYAVDGVKATDGATSSAAVREA